MRTYKNSAGVEIQADTRDITPLIFSLLGSYETLPFFDLFLAISRRVFVLLLTPFVLAYVLKKISIEIGRKNRFTLGTFILYLEFCTYSGYSPYGSIYHEIKER